MVGVGQYMCSDFPPTWLLQSLVPTRLGHTTWGLHLPQYPSLAFPSTRARGLNPGEPFHS